MSKRRSPATSFLPLRALTAAALLTALSVVLTRFASIMALGSQSVRIGLGALPLIVAGLLLGPLAGGLAGLAADLIGVMINLMGASFHPGFTLTSMLTGLLPGLALRLMKDRLELRTLLLAWASVSLVCALLLQTLWVAQLQGNPFAAVFMLRLTVVPLVQAVHLVLLLALFPALKRLPAFRRRALAGAGRID